MHDRPFLEQHSTSLANRTRARASADAFTHTRTQINARKRPSLTSFPPLLTLSGTPAAAHVSAVPPHAQQPCHLYVPHARQSPRTHPHLPFHLLQKAPLASERCHRPGRDRRFVCSPCCRRSRSRLLRLPDLPGPESTLGRKRLLAGCHQPLPRRHRCYLDLSCLLAPSAAYPIDRATKAALEAGAAQPTCVSAAIAKASVRGASHESESLTLGGRRGK
jgi:hypothetical protein